MLDYEYLFTTNLCNRLKRTIKGGVFVKVNENDSLVVEVKRKDQNNFSISFTDFSNRVMCGFTTEYATYEVMKRYKKFVISQFFK